MQELVNSNLAIRRVLRQLASTRNNMPIDVVDGNIPPKVTGKSWHYRTKGGSYIHHPSAYSKRGWSNMVYHCSTLSVGVGKDWLIKNLIVVH